MALVRTGRGAEPRGRDASLADWIANTIGTAAGTQLAVTADALLRRRQS